jgi:hypothetical protein
MKFSYGYATANELVAHLATVSRSSISAARKRYRASGELDVLARINTALVQVRIERLQQSLKLKGNIPA